MNIILAFDQHSHDELTEERERSARLMTEFVASQRRVAELEAFMALRKAMASATPMPEAVS